MDGNQVAALRAYYGLTQVQMARLMGWSTDAQIDIEKGRVKIAQSEGVRIRITLTSAKKEDPPCS